MTETLTHTELVEASRNVLDAELPAPTGLETRPLIERRKKLHPHLESLGWFDLLFDPEQGGLGLPPSFAARLIRLAGSYLAPGPSSSKFSRCPGYSPIPQCGRAC